MTRFLKIGPGVRAQIEASVPNIKDVVLYINSACNLRCKHCYVGNQLLNANNVFQTDHLCNFIEEFEYLSRITILGGEPLLHRGINQILRSALRSKIKERRLTTNLTGFFFLKYSEFKGTPLTFAVSLDGHDAPTHDFFRGAGTFARTIVNLQKLVEYGFDIEISHTITTKNIAHFERLLELCKKLGIKKLNLHKMSLQGNALDNSELYVKPSAWIGFCRRLETLASSTEATEKTVRIRYPPTYATVVEFERMVQTGEYWSHKQRSYYTDIDGGRIVLYPNGRVYISSELFGTDSHIGTVTDGDFQLNKKAQNEIDPAQQPNDPLLLSRLVRTAAGDDEYPAVLSVSFKKLVYG